MGLMKGGDQEVMYMDGMGWMSMADCHHCSMALPEGDEAWRAPTVTAEGWTMRVRCPLCARDMAAETKGRAILHIPTENQNHPLAVFSDEQGNLTTDMANAVFVEEEGSHRRCHRWSQAFTSKAALDEFIAGNPDFKTSRAISFQQWADRHGEKPDTYVKPVGPPGNPIDEVASTNEEDR